MYIRVLIYRALLETVAGENAARMMAMDNATNNCDDLVNSLTPDIQQDKTGLNNDGADGYRRRCRGAEGVIIPPDSGGA